MNADLERLGSLLGWFVNIALILLVAMIILGICLLAYYIYLGVFLTKFSKVKEGKSSPLAWIPICNLYLLGKLTYNKGIGWVFVILTILSSNIKLTIDGIPKTFSLLPSGIKPLVVFGLGVFSIITLIDGHSKYKKLKKDDDDNKIDTLKEEKVDTLNTKKGKTLLERNKELLEKNKS